MPVTSTLRGPRLRLRAVEPGDLAALTAIRAEPGVREWWGEPQPDDLEPPADGDLLAIDVDGAVAGAIQYEEVSDPQYRSAGIDLFLGAAWQGRGLGREAVGVLVGHLIESRGHHRLTIDPAADNTRAIAAYAKLGFRPVGRMRAYQRMTDGRWVDALLMDLLADELVR
jgi:aminoglycoside 6'-N-acetyltransferase